MKEYTIDDLREDYDQYNKDIWHNKITRHPLDNNCSSSGNFDKIGFILERLVTITNKNIELEERVKSLEPKRWINESI